MDVDRRIEGMSELRIRGLVAVLWLVLSGIALSAHAADRIASQPVHPNSREACRARKPVPSRFRIASDPSANSAQGVPRTGRIDVADRGPVLVVSKEQILALVSSPQGGRGGGVIEGVTHRVSGGDLVSSVPDRRQSRAWEICLGTRSTDPNTCRPGGIWVDSRKLLSAWDIVIDGAADVLRFRWTDDSLGLGVEEKLAVVGDAIHLKLSARTFGSKYGLVSARFPMLAVDHRASGDGDGELVLPRGNFGIKCRDCRGYQAMYPGIYQTMPWFGALKGSSGLYVGAHDPDGAIKRVVATGPTGPGISYFEIYPEESGAIGNSIDPDWYFEVAPVCAERGWPALAHRYKSWVTASTEWGRSPLLIDRADIPRELRDGAWWFVHSIVADGGIDLLEQGTERARKGFKDVPTVHHWYEWHTPGMDRGFPSHWPKAGTKEAIARLQADGKTNILLFTNATHTDQSSAPVESGRPLCPNGASQYPKYWRDTLQRADGTRLFVVPSSKACLAAMYLSSENWRSVVLENSDQVTNVLGAAGLYLDVLGNSSEGSWSPVRHPRGRGRWVTRAARDLVRAVSRRPQFVVVEGALEQMTGISAAGVNYLGSTVDMVPLFPLVFHERFILAGMVSHPPDDRHALRMKNGLGFAWGLQLGLSSLQWHEHHGPFNVKWARDLALSHRLNANWLAYGEYLGPIDQIDVASSQWVESKSWGAFIDDRPPVVHRRKAAEVSLFRGADGSMAIIAVNLGEGSVTTGLKLPYPFDESNIRINRTGLGSRERVLRPVAGVLSLKLAAGEILRGELIGDAGTDPTRATR